MSKEQPRQLTNGYVILATVIFAFLTSIALFIGGILAGATRFARRRRHHGRRHSALRLHHGRATASSSCSERSQFAPVQFLCRHRRGRFWWANPFMMKRKNVAAFAPRRGRLGQ